jgi:AraC family transcriptional regulator
MMASVEPIMNRCEMAGFFLNEAVFPPDFKVSKHAHSRAGFCVVIAGGCTEIYARKTRVYEPPTLEYLPAHEEHSLRVHRHGMRSFSVEFTSDWLKNLPESAPILNLSVYFKGGTLSTLLVRLYKEFKQSDELSPLVIEGLALEILGESSRVLLNREDRNLPRWLQDAEELVQARFAEHLGLSFVANIVGIHPVRLAREFRRRYGMTLGEYLRRLRMEYVTRELVRSELSLAEIANAAGFSDQSHMCRTFKRHTGLSPAKYRAVSRLR